MRNTVLIPSLAFISLAAATPVIAQQADAVSLSGFKTKYEDGRFSYVVTVTNVSKVRVKGAMCVQLFDKDGFEIERMVPPLLNLGVGDSQQDTFYRSFDPPEIKETTKVRAYFADWSCVTPPSDALSEIIDAAP